MTRKVTYCIQTLGGIILMVLALCLVSSCSDTLLDDDARDVPQADGAFEWTRAADRSTRLAFLRNYGVGYSYNAVNGEYCNWNDIRCQIINRNVVERVQELIPTETFYGQMTTEIVSYSSKYTYNTRDYVAGIRLDTKQAVDFGLYGKSKRTRQDVLEDGVRQQFYYSTDYSITKGQQWIDANNILAYIADGQYELMLTESFRGAVKHMMNAVYNEKHDELYLTAMVDSFLQVYGTHVVVSAVVGARLQLDLTHDMWRYNDQVQESEWTTEQILFAYSHRKENRKESIYKFIENTSINVSAYGGDQSYLTDFMGKTQYDGTRTFDAQGAIAKWSESVKFTPDDDKNSNVELVDMKVKPIWDFIEPLDIMGEVVDRVKVEIMQDISYQQDQLGSVSLFNTSFPVNIANPKVKVHESSGGFRTCSWESVRASFQDLLPQDLKPIVNIVSGGRYVATICHEEIDGKEYTTVYPIYNGKISCHDGLAIDGDKAYTIRWSYDNKGYELRQMSAKDAPQTDVVYINDGALSLVKQDELTYAEAHPMLYVESTGGVQYDGSFDSGGLYLPQKRGLNFFIADPLQGVVKWQFINWNWVKDSDSDVMKCMRDESAYTYIYSPTEMDYVE